jgi:nicotinamidase-related amidase
MSNLIGRNLRALRRWFNRQPKSNTALCIIDVQKRFSAAKEVVPKIIRQIEIARRYGEMIIVVELGNPPSYDEIYKALKGYSNWIIVKKTFDCGSTEIIQALGKNSRISTINVCGVNACQCVKSTASGLLKSRKFDKISIIYEATNCIHSDGYVCIDRLKEIFG